ncbi:MAG TPA: FAD-dependent oxidoreductase [Rhizomicrobium sp.]|jgi:spermidine dehydrogenase|nr:FAD-dependent oxidoreductase [Rhizomicrobium sp.]
MTRKRTLGTGHEIARRDFLQGAAIGVTMGALAPELAAAAQAEAQNVAGYYPPTRMGMRGSHPGSFEAAHAVRDGDFWKNAAALKDDGESYDLVVVGGGISGLSAAYFWRAAKPGAKILILENHDDFGGHAKRNEFHVGGRVEIINGGTLDIDSPYPYSAVSSGLLTALGVDAAKLEKECADASVYAGLKTGVFFDRETFGGDKLVTLDGDEDGATAPAWKAFVAKAPLSDAARASVLKIETGSDDYFPGLSSDQKKDKLWRMSYRDYLLNVVRADPGVVPLYLHRTDDLWGCGIDAVSALDCWGVGFPGFVGLKLKPGGPFQKRMGATPAGYSTTGGSAFFHFPDGNASIARLLVRALIPGAIPGKDAHDIVTARCDYAKLDRPENAVRIRLNQLAVRARNVGKGVEVAYTASRGGGTVLRVRAKACVLASWNMMIPYLVPELPAAQKAALHQLVKTPLVYANVALRNWMAFKSLGVKRIEAPGSYFANVSLNPAINIGGYRSVRSPDEPMLIRMLRTPAQPGLSEHDQHRAGRAELLATPFATFERNIRDQLGRTLGGAGFDPAKDIEGIAVNRWPHGYAPEYNGLWERDFDADHGPNIAGRKRFGRIAIANSDAGYSAYTDSAIDQAHRAVQELLQG